MSNLVHIDEEYKAWINNLSLRFKQSQIKAAIKVNSELLQFYWSLGKDLVELKVEERWGRGIMKTICSDLNRELPNISGLSEKNLYYCRRWHVIYSQHIAFSPQPVEKTDAPQVPQLVGKTGDKKIPQLVGKTDDNKMLSATTEFFSIPLEEIENELNNFND